MSAGPHTSHRARDQRSAARSVTANLSYQTNHAGCSGMLRSVKITALVQMSCFEELHEHHETFHRRSLGNTQ